MESLTVCRATLSAFSLPSIPQWSGVHINRMFFLALEMILLILIAKGLEWTLHLRLLRVLSESVQMLIIGSGNWMVTLTPSRRPMY